MTRDGLLEGLRGLAALDLLSDDQRRLAAEAAEKLAAELVYVAVIGEFKRGKSSLINALLGEALLPTGVIPVTAAPTLVRFGETARATVRLLDGSELPISRAELAGYVTEEANPGNRRKVREVVVEHPSPLLRPGLLLADTPGTGSIHTHNTEMAAAFLPRVDVALLVLTVDAPLSGAEAELLAAAGGTAARAAVCLNKIDLLNAAELEVAVEFVRSRMGGAAGPPIPVFPVSARRAGDSSDGGLDAVRGFLSEIAAGERDAVIGARARRVAEGLLKVGDAAIHLERAAAAQPAQRAGAARQAFAEAQSELDREGAEAVTLLLAACRQTEREVVEPQLAALLRDLPPALLAAPDEQWAGCSAHAAERWIDAVEAELGKLVEMALSRHGDRLQQRVERFVRRAGEAFGVALAPPPDVRTKLRIPELRIETADEPGAVAMGVRQLRSHMPGGLGRRWREGARRARAAEDADRLAGRLRYAALQAVDRAARTWAAEVEASWRSLSDSLGAAVTRAERAAGDPTEGVALRAWSRRLGAIRSALGRAAAGEAERVGDGNR